MFRSVHMVSTTLVTALLAAPLCAQGPGNPTFVNLPDVSVEAYYPNDPILAELNGDGNLDLVVCVGEPYMLVYMGNGDGTFGQRTEIPVLQGRVLSSVDDYDVNLDNNVDIVTANWASYGGGPPTFPDVSIFLGDGAGGFASNDYQVGTPSSWNPYFSKVGDLDGDGFGEVVSAHWSGASVTVMHGVGDGTFAYNPAVDQYPISDSSCTDAIMGDLNADDDLDLVVTGNFSSKVFVMLGNGDGTLQAPVPYDTLGRSGRADLADIDHDDDLDLVVNSWVSNNVAVLLGDGDGAFQPMVQYDAGSIVLHASFVDIDGDGEIDIVASNQGPPNLGLGGVSVLLGNGNGTFQPYLHFPSGHQVLGHDIGDLNGDGALDIVLANNRADSYTVLLQVPGNTAPVADIVCDQLTDIGAEALVRLDGSYSSDAEDPNSALTFQWTVDAVVICEGSESTCAVVQTSLGFGPHQVTLRVTDPQGAYGEATKTVTISSAQLSVLDLDKAKVYFDPGNPRVKLKGEVGLPSGVDYSELAATVVVDLEVAGPFLPFTPVAFDVSGGKLEKWKFHDSGALGITKFDIDWDGARFDFKSGPIRLRSQIISSDETVLTLEYKLKQIAGPFTIDIGGLATLDVDASGDVTANVPFEVEKLHKEVTLTLPFPLLDSSLITISGAVSESILVSNHMKYSVGRFRLDVSYDAALFPAGVLTTPRSLQLALFVGTQAYPGLVLLDADDLEVKGNKWGAKH